MAIAVLAAASCGGTDAGPTDTPAPTASEQPTPSPTASTAIEILRLSDEGMNRLHSLTVRYGLNEVTMLFEAPDSWMSDPDVPGARCVAAGLAWRRPYEEPSDWVRDEDPVTPITWPNFDRLQRAGLSVGASQIGATLPSNFRILSEDVYASEPVYVVAYDFMAPSIEGPVPVSRTEWIAKSNYWLLKEEVWQNDPFGFTGTYTNLYTGHNDPVDIVCADFAETGG